MNLVILGLLIGRIIALVLSADVIYRQIQLRRRTINPKLKVFRDRSFHGAIGVFALNIFPALANLTYLTLPKMDTVMSSPIGLVYSMSFMLLSLSLAYVTNDIYRRADDTESLVELIKRKIIRG